MTRVSIAMATFNGERFLREQLDSFTRQLRLPDELVVCDDQSADGTVAIVEEFALTSPFPVHIHRNSQRLGYSWNFEGAISRTSGDLIFISDQDDVWFPEKIATVLETMGKAGRPVVTVNDQRIVDADGRGGRRTIFLNSRRAGFADTELIAGSCTALPRSLLPVVLPFPAGVPYDSWIGAVADSLGIKRLIEQSLQDFRRHQANASDPIAVSAPHQLGTFARYGFADPRGGWQEEIAWRRTLIDRLSSSSSALQHLASSDEVTRAAEINKSRIKALEDRSKILSRPRSRRPFDIYRAWRHGIYDAFAGIRSLVKDLVRP